MKRPVLLIVGSVAGALILAAVGASAHSGSSAAHLLNLRSEATANPTETPEPAETPEASPTAEPTTEPAETETEDADDANDATEVDEDDNGAVETGAPTAAGEHESGSTSSKDD